MMERNHQATVHRLAEIGGDDGPDVPLSPAWFESVREACVRTGPVPGAVRSLFEWWNQDPASPGGEPNVWLFGVWQGYWVCWAGTTGWASPDLSARTSLDQATLRSAVRFGASFDPPPSLPWPPFGTSSLAVPTAIMDALSGQGGALPTVIPATPPAAAIVPAPPPVEAAVPAGWHPDPWGRQQLRYWDGSNWTPHAVDRAGVQVQDPI